MRHPSRWQLCGVLAGVTLLSILAIACGDEDEDGAATATPTATATPAATGTPALTGTATATATASATPTATPVFGPPLTVGSLTVQVGTDREVYQPGEPVAVTLIISASESTALYYRTSQRFDFAAADAEARVIWRWSADRTFLQVLVQETIGPGTELVYREEWGQRDSGGSRLPPGIYTVMGESTHCDENYDNCGGVVASTTIEIVGQ
jgi:hypothetical protein